MFEAYTVGTTLKLNNLVSPQLLVLAQEFEKLEKLSGAAQKSIKAMGAEAPAIKKLSNAFASLHLMLDKGARNAQKFEANIVGLKTALNAAKFTKLDGLAGNFGKSADMIERQAVAIKKMNAAAYSSNTAFSRAATSAAAYHQSLAGIGAMAGGMPALPVVPRAVRAAGGGAGAGGGGAHASGSAHVHMGASGVGVGTLSMGAGGYFWPLAAGAAAVWGGKALFESAKDLDREKQRFKLFGMSDAQNTEAFRFVSGMKIYGTTQTQNMTNFREAQGVFRESGLSGSAALEGAKLAAPVLAKIGFATAALDDESKARMKTASMAMLRFVEESGGLKSAAEFNRIAELGWKLTQTSGGAVNWEQLRAFKARAGAAGYNLTDEAIAKLEPVIASLKGGQVGFGERTAFNRISGSIKVPNFVAHLLVDSGIWDKKLVEWNKNGGVIFKGVHGPLKKDLAQQFITDTPEFYYKNIIPMYKKMGLNESDMTRYDTAIFGSTGAAMVGIFRKQESVIKNALTAYQKAMGLDKSVEIARGAASAQEEEFGAAWTDFSTKFGTIALPFFTGILKAGSSIIRQITPSDQPSAQDVRRSKAPSFIDAIGSVFHGHQHYVPGKGRSGSGGTWEYDAGFAPSHKTSEGGQRPVILTVNGRVLGEVVGHELSKGAARPQTGTSGYDSRMHPIPAGGH